MIAFPILPAEAESMTTRIEDLPSSWRFQQWNSAEQMMRQTPVYNAFYQFQTINGFQISYEMIQAVAPCELTYHCQSAVPVLTYVLKGNLEVYVSGKIVGAYTDSQYSLWQTPTNISLQLHCRKGEHHIFQIAFSNNLLSILFNQSVAQIPFREDPTSIQLSPVLPIRQPALHILKDVLRYAKKLNTYIVPLNTKLWQLIERFVRAMIQTEKSREWKKKKTITLAELALYIEEHLDFDDRAALSITELARKIHTQPYQFQKLFKAQFGVSLARYIQKRRMEKAVQLLTEAALPIGAIYLQVGYSDFSSFSRAFTAYYGYAPSRLSRQ
jgi:AraC-like DNA-binding protein